MGIITVYNPGDENYETVQKIAQRTGITKSSATERYNEIAEAYNQLTLDAYISVSWKGIRLSNLEKVLYNRGVLRDQDYALSRAMVDLEGKKLHRDERPVLIRRLTDTAMRVV